MFRTSRELLHLLAEEREAHRKERQELLNRLARPEVIVQDRADLPDPEPPSKDLEELAQVGGVASDTFRAPVDEEGLDG